jgi:hypothetical protein
MGSPCRIRERGIPVSAEAAKDPATAPVPMAAAAMSVFRTGEGVWNQYSPARTLAQIERPMDWEKIKLMDKPRPYPMKVKKTAMRVLKPIVMARTLRIFFPLIALSDVTMLTIPALRPSGLLRRNSVFL